ncbi:MAG: alginate O-acetyltransferase AlgF [Alphaproteobacteria bacterium]
MRTVPPLPLSPAAVLALGGLIAAAPALAQDEGLYDPAPPPGAAFVRVINLAGGDAAEEVTIGQNFAGSVAALQASPYYVVEERETAIALGDAEATAEIEPGRFFSVVARAGADGLAVTTLEDTPNTDRTKAQLALYNLTPEADVDLVTADDKVVVFDDVGPDSAQYRTVNAVTIGLAVKVNGTVVATFDAVPLERGMAFGFLVGGDGPSVEMVRAETRR